MRTSFTLAAALMLAATLAPGQARTANLTTLVNFNQIDGSELFAGLIADANGNLFGTTTSGGTSNAGTVFEIAKTTSGYANTPTTLVNFNNINGAYPWAGLIADASGNLFGTTNQGGHMEMARCSRSPRLPAVTLAHLLRWSVLELVGTLMPP